MAEPQATGYATTASRGIAAGSRASKQRLLQSIVRLDKQREANSIAEGEYQPRRQNDKKRLLTT